MTTILYGASDDLVELDGGISEEFQARSDDGGQVLGFSNGVLLALDYDDDGIWRISPVVGTRGDFTIDQAIASEGDDRPVEVNGKIIEVPAYSDYALIEGEVAWVTHGTQWTRRQS